MSATTSVNTTHRKRLARRLAEATGVPYQQALTQVVAAADAGMLPTPLDPDGMDAALRTLSAVAAHPALMGAPTEAPLTTAGTSLTRWFVDIPKEYAKEDKVHQLWDRPVPEYAGRLISVDTTGDQYSAQAAASRVLGNRGWAGIASTTEMGPTPEEVFAHILDHPHHAIDETGSVEDCLGCQFAANPPREVEIEAETGDGAGDRVKEGPEVADSATNSPSVTRSGPPEALKPGQQLWMVAHEGNRVPRCTSTSWRGGSGIRAGSGYGPGGYNRCVKNEGHAPEDGGADPMHVDEWGNLFRLHPKFRVLRNLSNAEMAEVAREAGMHVATMFDREPMWHKRQNTLWMTKDKEMVKVSNVYENEGRVTGQVVYPVPPRTTVRSYPAAEVARWKEPTSAQMHRYERAWGFEA